MRNILDTQEKRNKAVADFTGLLGHPGWQLFEEIVNANIEVIKQQILDGVEGETPDTIKRLRDKLKICEEMRDTPRNIIQKAKEEPIPEPDADPYPTVEDIRDLRMKNA